MWAFMTTIIIVLTILYILEKLLPSKFNDGIFKEGDKQDEDRV